MTESPGSGARKTNKIAGAVVFVLAFALVTGGVLMLRRAARAPGTATPASDAAPSMSLTTLDKLLEDAQIAMGQQDYATAERILAEVVKAFPSDQNARLSLAQTLVTRKKFKEAYEQYEAAIALSPKAEGKAGAGDPKLHFEAGTVANQAGLIERAEEHYSMAQAGDPTEPRYPLYLGMIQIKLGKDGPALASLIRATKLNPDLAVAWGTLAELALSQNQLGLAAQHIEKARKLEPDAARWRVDEARILMRGTDTAQFEKALQLMLSLEKADRMQPDVLEAIGECYGLLKRPADAAYMYAEALKLRPDDMKLASEAATWYHRAGRDEEAIRYGKLAQELAEKQRPPLASETPDLNK